MGKKGLPWHVAYGWTARNDSGLGNLWPELFWEGLKKKILEPCTLLIAKLPHWATSFALTCKWLFLTQPVFVWWLLLLLLRRRIPSLVYSCVTFWLHECASVLFSPSRSRANAHFLQTRKWGQVPLSREKKGGGTVGKPQLENETKCPELFKQEQLLGNECLPHSKTFRKDWTPRNCCLTTVGAVIFTK